MNTHNITLSNETAEIISAIRATSAAFDNIRQLLNKHYPESVADKLLEPMSAGLTPVYDALRDLLDMIMFENIYSLKEAI